MIKNCKTCYLNTFITGCPALTKAPKGECFAWCSDLEEWEYRESRCEKYRRTHAEKEVD